MEEKGQTLEDLLDEYGEIYKFWDKNRRKNRIPTHVDKGIERMRKIKDEIKDLLT